VLEIPGLLLELLTVLSIQVQYLGTWIVKGKNYRATLLPNLYARTICKANAIASLYPRAPMAYPLTPEYSPGLTRFLTPKSRSSPR
jgi:hypothetical protein